jgi:hypothetical protein
MRENRQSGLEGGVALTPPSLPLSGGILALLASLRSIVGSAEASPHLLESGASPYRAEWARQEPHWCPAIADQGFRIPNVSGAEPAGDVVIDMEAGREKEVMFQPKTSCMFPAHSRGVGRPNVGRASIRHSFFSNNVRTFSF